MALEAVIGASGAHGRRSVDTSLSGASIHKFTTPLYARRRQCRKEIFSLMSRVTLPANDRVTVSARPPALRDARPPMSSTPIRPPSRRISHSVCSVICSLRYRRPCMVPSQAGTTTRHLFFQPLGTHAALVVTAGVTHCGAARYAFFDCCFDLHSVMCLDTLRKFYRSG